MFKEVFKMGTDKNLPISLSVYPDDNNKSFFVDDNPLIVIEAVDEENPLGEWKLITHVSSLQLTNCSKTFSSYGEAVGNFSRMKNRLQSICETQKKLEFHERQLERFRNEIDDEKNSFYSYCEE